MQHHILVSGSFVKPSAVFSPPVPLALLTPMCRTTCPKRQPGAKVYRQSNLKPMFTSQQSDHSRPCNPDVLLNHPSSNPTSSRPGSHPHPPRKQPEHLAGNQRQPHNQQSGHRREPRPTPQAPTEPFSEFSQGQDGARPEPS